MKQKLLLLSIPLIGCALFGNIAIAQYDRNAKGEGSEPHEHQMMAIPNGQPVPAVDLIVHQDKVKGWNLELKVNNFRFAPERVNQTSDFSEGHAHLYINGEKITRLYGNWYYLSELKPERNEIKVSLNANGHEALMNGGNAIADVAIVETE